MGAVESVPAGYANFTVGHLNQLFDVAKLYRDDNPYYRYPSWALEEEADIKQITGAYGLRDKLFRTTEDDKISEYSSELRLVSIGARCGLNYRNPDVPQRSAYVYTVASLMLALGRTPSMLTAITNHEALDRVLVEHGVPKNVAQSMGLATKMRVLDSGDFTTIPPKVSRVAALQPHLVYMMDNKAVMLDSIPDSVLEIAEAWANLSEDNVEDVIQKYKLIVPPTVSRLGYVKENLPSMMRTKTSKKPEDVYDLLFSSNMDLDSFSDKRIQKIFRVTVGHTNRPMKMSLLLRYLAFPSRGPVFFVPEVRRSYNAETTLGTPTSDMNVFMIGFGTWHMSRLYEVEELTVAFSNGPRRPETPDKFFTSEELQELRLLLHMFPQDIVGELDKAVEFCLDSYLHSESNIKDLRATFDIMHPSLQEIIHEILKILLEAGMLMRRWKGKGHPFPLKVADTLGDFDPRAEVTNCLGRLAEAMDRNQVATDFVMNLSVIKQADGAAVVSERFVGDLFEELNEEPCIRIESASFVGTAAYFLSHLFDEDIDMREMDSVQ